MRPIIIGRRNGKHPVIFSDDVYLACLSCAYMNIAVVDSHRKSFSRTQLNHGICTSSQAGYRFLLCAGNTYRFFIPIGSSDFIAIADAGGGLLWIGNRDGDGAVVLGDFDLRLLPRYICAAAVVDVKLVAGNVELVQGLYRADVIRVANIHSCLAWAGDRHNFRERLFVPRFYNSADFKFVGLLESFGRTALRQNFTDGQSVRVVPLRKRHGSHQKQGKQKKDAEIKYSSPFHGCFHFLQVSFHTNNAFCRVIYL